MIKCDCESRSDCRCEKGVVCLKNVSFNRGPKRVLEDISFCIDEGIFLGLIGPNGGGKTTLLRMILGVLKPQHGEVLLFGEKPDGGSRRKAQIGYVPQRFDVDQDFPASAMDVVMMGATAQAGIFRRIAPNVKDRAMQLLERVGMADLAGRPIGRMSGGQQQRVYIARALINEPKLLILDEPTVGIDSAGQQRFLHLIQQLMAEMKLTTLMVSHDVGQLSHYADQIACLNRKLHWHDSSALLTGQVLSTVYSCEMDAYKERVKEIAPH